MNVWVDFKGSMLVTVPDGLEGDALDKAVREVWINASNKDVGEYAEMTTWEKE